MSVDKMEVEIRRCHLPASHHYHFFLSSIFLVSSRDTIDIKKDMTLIRIISKVRNEMYTYVCVSECFPNVRALFASNMMDDNETQEETNMRDSLLFFFVLVCYVIFFRWYNSIVLNLNVNRIFVCFLVIFCCKMLFNNIFSSHYMTSVFFLSHLTFS